MKSVESEQLSEQLAHQTGRIAIVSVATFLVVVVTGMAYCNQPTCRLCGMPHWSAHSEDEVSRLVDLDIEAAARWPESYKYSGERDHLFVTQDGTVVRVHVTRDRPRIVRKRP